MSQQQTVGKTSTTVVQDEAGTLRVTYHSTVVVKATKNEIVLDTGGWKTATTKTRMNQASNQYGLGFRVRQVDGEWLVDHGPAGSRCDVHYTTTTMFMGNTVTLNRRA